MTDPAEDRVRWWPGPPNTYNATDDRVPRNRRIKAGLYGLQRCLRGAGCDCVLNGTYDEYTRRAVAYFQGSKTQGRCPETGVFDLRTARELFSRTCTFFENAYALPGPYLKGFCAHEGVWDMAALGPNLKDTGLTQINLSDDQYGRIVDGRPLVSQMQACDPLFSITWTATRLINAMVLFDDWDAAIVEHRAPAWADRWVGATPWDSDEQHVEAVDYVRLIKSGG